MTDSIPPYQPVAAAAVPRPRKPFAYQAATYSVLAPAIAIAVSISITAGTRGNQGVSNNSTVMMSNVIVAIVGGVLILTAFAMSIYALVSMRELGTRGLLGRGIVGFLFSGLLIAGGSYAFFHDPLATMRHNLEGHWSSTLVVANAGTFHPQMDLAADGSAHWFAPDGPNHSDFRGHWKLLHRKDGPHLVLAINLDNPAPGGPSNVAWKILSLRNDRLELQCTDLGGKPALEIFTRVTR